MRVEHHEDVSVVNKDSASAATFVGPSHESDARLFAAAGRMKAYLERQQQSGQTLNDNEELVPSCSWCCAEKPGPCKEDCELAAALADAGEETKNQKENSDGI